MSEYHSAFLWGAYSVTFLLLLLEVFFVLKRKRETQT
jgi:hypothetical protein